MLPLIDVKKPAYKVKIINGVINGVRCGDEIKRFFHVFLDIQDRRVFDV